MNNNNVAEVFPLKINLNHGFYYFIPLSLKKAAEVGKRVIIPFRNSKKVGIIVNIFESTELQDLKEIEEVLDPVPILSQKILLLTDWMAKYYLCPKGIIVSTIIPHRVSAKKITEFLNNGTIADAISQRERNVYKKQSSENTTTIKDNQYNLFPSQSVPITEKKYKPILFQYHSFRERDLYYIHLIMDVIEEGKQVLLLIPDQYSCKGLKEKLTKKLGKSLVIFDKNVSQAERYLRYIKVQNEALKVVIGTRSSIFLPFYNLGLIIVEQENSTLYKEERTPRYHAREVAEKRGLLESAQVILASGAPSIESYWQGLNNDFYLKTEEATPDSKEKKLLQTLLVDLEEEKSFQRVISFRLQQEIVQCLKEEKGVVLFHKRRGFASYIYCGHCGQVIKCPTCNSLLSYQEVEKKGVQVCNKCGKRIPYSRYCPKCREKALKPMGFGTQYVEEMTRRMFPRAVIQRFDTDIAPNLRIQQQLLRKFKKGEINILIATQLLFKRLDYKSVGLVGFILIDHLLNVPDYRSAEDAFQFVYHIALHLLEQKVPGVLLIQTFLPEHHSLQAVKELNYPLFYQKEIMLRKELEYPPFTRIIKIDFSGNSEEHVKDSIQEFREFIKKINNREAIAKDIFLNDFHPLVVKDKGESRVSFLIRVKNEKDNFEKIKEVLFPFVLKFQRNRVKLIIDVEPTKLY